MRRCCCNCTWNCKIISFYIFEPWFINRNLLKIFPNLLLWKDLVICIDEIWSMIRSSTNYITCLSIIILYAIKAIYFHNFISALENIIIGVLKSIGCLNVINMHIFIRICYFKTVIIHFICQLVIFIVSTNAVETSLIIFTDC